MPTRKDGWKTVAFGDVVRLSKERSSDPESDGFERYVGLEHIEPGDLRIRRWGDIAEGTTFTNVFRAGQVLFGKRRAYQRKVAVADFSGVCSGDIYVFEPRGDDLLPELLPFLCQTDAFFEYAIGTSAGSLSPRTNWRSLSQFEFALPPIEEQQRMKNVLDAVECATESHTASLAAAEITRAAVLDCLTHEAAAWKSIPIATLCDPEAPLCYGVVQPGNAVEGEVPLLRVCDLDQPQVDHSALKRISREVDHEYRRSRVQHGDVLVSVVGTIGRIFVASEAENGCNIARAIARIRTNSYYLPEFLAAILRSPRFQRLLTGESFETARKTLNLEALGQIEVPLPSVTEQQNWCDRVDACSIAIDQLRSRRVALRHVKRHLLNALAEGTSK